MLQIHFIEEHASEVIESTDNCGTVDEFGEDSSKVAFLDIPLPYEKGLDSVYDAINSILKARYLFRILDPQIGWPVAAGDCSLVHLRLNSKAWLQLKPRKSIQRSGGAKWMLCWLLAVVKI
ncbi:MAG: hypothetical protein K8R06_02880 [Methanosarcinales archaeon]|nr:hypothetical protein [Methanosarcinales archaeon]